MSQARAVSEDVINARALRITSRDSEWLSMHVRWFELYLEAHCRPIAQQSGRLLLVQRHQRHPLMKDASRCVLLLRYISTCFHSIKSNANLVNGSCSSSAESSTVVEFRHTLITSLRR